MHQSLVLPQFFAHFPAKYFSGNVQRHLSKNSTNINIKKVHNDGFDSKKAALVGLKPDLKVSLMPSDLALNCRNLCREYYNLMDNRSSYVNKLQGKLRMAFPQYLGIFSKVITNTSLTLLETYTSPSAYKNITFQIQ